MHPCPDTGANVIPSVQIRQKSSAPRAKVNPTPPIPPDSPLMPAFLAARRGDFVESSRCIKSVNRKSLPTPEARRWRLLATEAAIRTGDIGLLRLANANGENALFADGRLILHAWEYAQIAEYTLAKATLRKIKRQENLDERSRRRYLALVATIASREGDHKTERVYLAKLIDYLGAWKTPTCQECHENPEQYGDDVTSMDARSRWFAIQFTDVLKRDGDARSVQMKARAVLVSQPDDERAKLRLAYSLMAENKDLEAEAVFRQMDWVTFPDRTFKKPDNDLVFPGSIPLPHDKRRTLSTFLAQNQVQSAKDFLFAGRFDETRQELAAVAPYSTLPYSLHYKALAIEARLARLENNRGAEKQSLQAMITHLRRVAGAKNAMTLSDETWWVTRRLTTVDSAEMERIPWSSSSGLTTNELKYYP